MVNIAHRPKWDLAKIQGQVRQGAFSLVNQRARTKVKSLGWKTETIRSFLLALKSTHFRKTFLKQSAYDGRKELDADAYKMHFNEPSLCEGTSRHECFWVKLALEPHPTQPNVAIVSIHLDGAP